MTKVFNRISTNNFFDASINRITSWIIGIRNVKKIMSNEK